MTPLNVAQRRRWRRNGWSWRSRIELPIRKQSMPRAAGLHERIRGRSPARLRRFGHHRIGGLAAGLRLFDHGGLVVGADELFLVCTGNRHRRQHGLRRGGRTRDRLAARASPCPTAGGRRVGQRGGLSRRRLRRAHQRRRDGLARRRGRLRGVAGGRFGDGRAERMGRSCSGPGRTAAVGLVRRRRRRRGISGRWLRRCSPHCSPSCWSCAC